MPRKNPLPLRELEICWRLREFRSKTKLAQSAFAKEIDIDSARLASYEHARAALKYSLAERLANTFKISLQWLAVGKGDILAFHPVPSLSDLKASPSAKFSEIYDQRLAPGKDFHDYGLLPRPLHFYGDRYATLKAMNQNFEVWLSRVPEARTDEFYQRFFQLIEQRFRSLFDTMPNAALQALLELRLENAKTHKSLLTDYSEKHTNESTMKPIPTLRGLLEAVKKATAKRGQRAALARAFKISPASLSEWLRGESEPGGEITLRLWKWVTDPKRH